MSENRFGWIEEYETFGWLVVEGMSEADVVARLGGGAAVALTRENAWEWDGSTFGVRAEGGRVLLWDDADLGLDARIPLWLSESGRCVAVAWGMNSCWFTLAEAGLLVRRFDPMMRGPVEDDDLLYADEAEAEADREGDPLPSEGHVEWAAGTRGASLHLLELLTGVTVAPEPWDDVGMRWFGIPDLPQEPPPPLPRLLGRLLGDPADVRDARLRTGLTLAAECAGLSDNTCFSRALADADAVRALADPPGVPSREDEVGGFVLLAGDNPRRRERERAAIQRLMIDWELPLGQRIDPDLYPGDGPWPLPKRAPRPASTAAERAELSLARACVFYLTLSGLHEVDEHSVDQVVHRVRLASGDRWAEVELAMLDADG
jgi:hypothetical protein